MYFVLMFVHDVGNVVVSQRYRRVLECESATF